MPRSNEVERKRKLGMRKLHGVNALTVQCGAINIAPHQARELMRRAKHWVTEVVLTDDTLVVFYSGCTLERAKLTVFQHLGEHVF